MAPGWGWSPERPSHNQKLGIFSTTTHPPERGGGYKQSGKLIMPTRGSCHENPNSTAFRELPGWATRPHWERDAPRLQENRRSCPLAPPRPHPLYLYIWLFIYILYGSSSISFIISFNTLVNISKCFPEFCELL